MIEAELDDGTVLEFPDGTSPEVIQATVKQQILRRNQAVQRGAQGIPGMVLPSTEFAPRGARLPEMITPSGADPIREATGGLVTRAVPEAIGAVAGATAGAPAGPVGSFGGGALGLAAGSYLYDAANQAVRALRGEPQIPPAENIRRGTEQALEDVAIDTATAGAFRLAKPAAKAVGRFVAGVPQSAAPGVAAATAQGIDIPPSATGIRAGGFRRAFGQLPFVGTPFRKAGQRTSQQIGAAMERVANDIGLDLTRDEAADFVADTGIAQAQGALRQIRGAYDAVRQAAQAAGDPAAFPTAGLRDVGERFLQDVGEASTRAMGPVSGAAPREAIRGIQPVLGAKSAEDFLLNLANVVPDNLTFQQLDTIRKRARYFLGQAAVQGTPTEPALQAVRGAAREALGAAGQPEIAQAARRANEMYRTFRQFVDDPALRAVRAAAPRVARGGAAGQMARPTITRPEMLDRLVRESSPRNLRMIRTVIGDEAFSQIGRRRVVNSLERALRMGDDGIARIDVEDLREQLGLTSREGLDRLEELLAGSNVEIGDIRRLTDAIEAAGDLFVPSTSTFIARSLGLRAGASGNINPMSLFLTGAGSTAAAGAGAAAGGMLGGLMGAMGPLITLRLVGEAFANPRAMRAMLRVTDPSVPQSVKEILLRRLLIDELQADDPPPEVLS